MPLSFQLLATDGRARRGRLTTPHGVIETPAFMPVGTLGAVKGVAPDALETAGAQVMLANLYHLSLRPGIDVIESLGGLHQFSGWDRPILTDSGGFQVFSLGSLRKLDRDGVTFKSHVDGAMLRMTPESVVDSQRRLGVDIAMMLDECPPWPAERSEVEGATDRTVRWAERAADEWQKQPGPGGLFGIVQGGTHLDLRERSVEATSQMGFDGYAVGGVSVGEPKPQRRVAVEHTVPRLPSEAPRYLMGVGTPGDILHAVLQGVDLFDCVMPARNGRHGNLFTREGVVKIKNARYRNDPRPIEDGCRCPACRRVSRAFLHHLIRSGEITGRVLATLHNLTFYLDFMAQLGKATESGTLSELAADWTARLEPGESFEGDAQDPRRSVPIRNTAD